MLNIGKLARGAEDYYLNAVARGVEDYYLGSGEAPGYWLASGSQELGLEGEVGESQLRYVLNGRHPETGAELVKNPKGGRVPGFDLTFRAPKSVALLHALGPKEASNEVVSAHDAAVAAAVDYLERHCSNARRGDGGKSKIASKGFVAAAFRHRTSRAGDPLLHTHVLAANLIEGSDGRFGAIDARQIYVHAKTAGYLYQAHLRAELSRRLGLAWEPVRNGTADIEGIPRAVIKAFSRRRQEIEALVGEARGSPGAAQVAALQSRKAKDYGVDAHQLLSAWEQRAQDLGFTREQLDSTLGRIGYRAPSLQDEMKAAAEMVSVDGLTARDSTFSARDVIQGYCNRLQGGAKVEHIEAMAARFLGSELVVDLGSRDGDRRDSIRLADGRLVPAASSESLFSTPEMLETERRVLAHAVGRSREQTAVVDAGVVDQAIRSRPSLFADQQDMVRDLTTSGRGVDLVVGRAGAGKTFALAAAREAWEHSGHRVIGCAVAARAAQELEAGSGIPSFTLARLLKDLDDPYRGGLPPRSVVIVDEAAMVPTRELDRVLAHAARACAKVVLVGDHKQLPEIDAGGAFAGIRQRIAHTELAQVRRQPLGWERDALELLREGRATEALSAYGAHGRLSASPESDKTREALIEDWWQASNSGAQATMIALRRNDVADLNARARAKLREAGRLGDDCVSTDLAEFSVGDQVMTTKRYPRLGVINGTRGVIEAVDPDSRTVTMRCADGRAVSLPCQYLDEGRLVHTYAITGHKSQGMTTDSALVLGDETLYREWAYVAMSRGRGSNKIYAVAGLDPDREELGGDVERVVDPTAAVARAIARSRAKELALDASDADFGLGRELERSLEL